MRKALIMLAVTATLAACGSSDEEADRPGSPDVYERIESSSDCAALQQEFDTASANHDRAEPGSAQAEAATAYMTAADERLQELDCY